MVIVLERDEEIREIRSKTNHLLDLTKRHYPGLQVTEKDGWICVNPNCKMTDLVIAVYPMRNCLTVPERSLFNLGVVLASLYENEGAIPFHVRKLYEEQGPRTHQQS